MKNHEVLLSSLVEQRSFLENTLSDFAAAAVASASAGNRCVVKEIVLLIRHFYIFPSPMTERGGDSYLIMCGNDTQHLLTGSLWTSEN